jgi:hypothetical protein
VRSLDALAAGLGLDLETRATLSTEARRARHGTLEAMQAAAGGAEAGRRHGPAGADPLAGMYRALQRVLLAGLASDDREAAGLVGDLDPVAAIFFAHRQRLAEVAKRARAARLLPALRRCLPDFLHLAAVRLAGPDALREASGVYLWQRALEGRVARARAARSAPRRRGSTDGAP